MNDLTWAHAAQQAREGEGAATGEGASGASRSAGGAGADASMPSLVIITGMSGAGRTEAMHVFEDLGYFCVDNLPAVLIGDLVNLKMFPDPTGGVGRMAVVCDARNRLYFGSLMEEVTQLKDAGVDYRIVFLDASDEMLIARYKSSRRRHPMCEDGCTISAGIRRERELLFGLREIANDVIDTSHMLPQQLRVALRKLFSGEDRREGMAVSVYSFGFKYGAAADADVVMDVRFLPNPFYEEKLKHLTGLDTPVREFVLYRTETSDFLARWHALLDCIMPAFVTEGKQQLAIALGCTGGQHRSVVLAEETADYLKACGYRASIAHRDLSKANSPLDKATQTSAVAVNVRVADVTDAADTPGVTATPGVTDTPGTVSPDAT